MQSLTFRQTAALTSFFAGAAALLLASFQTTISPATFEFQQFRPHTGRILLSPYPTLLSGQTLIPLVAPGKHGAGFLFEGMDGASISLRASRIHREGTEMLEVLPPSIQRVSDSSSAPVPPLESLGGFTLSGEIVDSKCFLGVMNPGSGRVHRECAIRCISGGVPPLFVIRDRAGRKSFLWLAGPTGQPLPREALGYIAEPVQVSGRLFHQRNLLYFWIDLHSIRRE